jgi:excisionase family DNA binding protein
MGALGQAGIMDKTPRRELMTATETCRFLKMTRSTLDRYLRSRHIPAFKLGTEWRFIRSDLEQWIQDNQARPPVNS